MKQKVFDYIEELERKAKESDKYFKLWHEEKIKNNKAIEYIKEKYDYILKDDTFLDHDERIDRKQVLSLLDILKGVDKE